jgi:hypothetical protein
VLLASKQVWHLQAPLPTGQGSVGSPSLRTCLIISGSQGPVRPACMHMILLLLEEGVVGSGMYGSHLQNAWELCVCYGEVKGGGSHEP